MGDLTREQILRSWQAEDKPLPVEVPAWGGTVYVKRLSAAEVTELGGDEDTVAYRAFVRAVIDANGERLFQDGDVPALMARPYATIVTLLKTVMDHNGMSAEAAEEMVRDFGLTVPGSDSTGSPSPSESRPAKREPVSQLTS